MGYQKSCFVGSICLCGLLGPHVFKNGQAILGLLIVGGATGSQVPGKLGAVGLVSQSRPSESDGACLSVQYILFDFTFC